MITPLDVALDIGRTIAKAQDEERAIDVMICATELYLRFFASGCSRDEIAEALTVEACAVGLTFH